MISHQNVIAQCLQIKQISPPDLTKILAVVRLPCWRRLYPDHSFADRAIHWKLPLFHITGLVHALHLPVVLNASVIMLPSFSMPTMLKAIRDYELTELLLVPPLLIRMVRDPSVDPATLKPVKRFSSGTDASNFGSLLSAALLLIVSAGAAPLSPEILHLLEKKFPGTGFKQGYGMTESCSCITAHPPEFYDYKYAAAVGTIVASTTVKILKSDGSDGKVGEQGEILARGPQIT